MGWTLVKKNMLPDIVRFFRNKKKDKHVCRNATKIFFTIVTKLE